MNDYLIALGSNLSFAQLSKVEILEKTLFIMRDLEINIIGVSDWWESRAFPVGSGPNYINGVIKASSKLTPDEALQSLKKIEVFFGRNRSERWGSRTLDLDILDCNSMILPTKVIFMKWLSLSVELQLKREPSQLILPHPRIQDRLFVLRPLLEVSPNWVHPVLGKKPQELIDDSVWMAQDSLKLFGKSKNLFY